MGGKTKRFSFILTITVLFVILINSNVFSQETPDELCTRLKALRKEQGKPEEAEQQALEFLQTHTEKDLIRQKIYYEYSAALFQQKKFNDAKAAFAGLVNEYAETTLDKDSADFMVDDAQYFYAMIEQTQGEKDLDKAIVAYKVVAEKFPKSNWRPNAIFSLGDLSRAKSKWDDSLNYYYKVVADYPNSDLAPSALLCANRVLIDHIDNAVKKIMDPNQKDTERVDKQKDIKNNITTAMRYYAGSQKVPEMLQDYIVYLVWRLTDENKEELRKVCYRLMENYPGTKQAEYARQELVDQLILWGTKEQLELANQLTDEGIAKYIAENNLETAANYYYAKARLRIRQQKYKEAREVLEEALEETSGIIVFEFKFQLAMTYCHEKNYEEARKIFEALAEDFKGEKDKRSMALFSIGQMYRSEKKYAEALVSYQAVVNEFPELNAGVLARQEIQRCEDAIEKSPEK